MKSSLLTRRSFLQRTLLASAAVSATRIIPAPNLVAASPGDRIKVVQVGCGGRGLSAHLRWLVTQSKDHVVGIVDADERRIAASKRWMERQGVNCADLKTYNDYRVMFDKIGNEIDAIFVATPNHHHALPSLIAMELNKGVYCEKPLCHDIHEARTLRAMAARSKAPTQMGNQGHCMDGYRRLCEFVWSGLVGHITETHSWSDRANGGTGPRPAPIPVPKGMHWDNWIGPAPYREFHTDLHPHEWHGWYDFGNGSIGNMGCHIMDGVYWALNLGYPNSFEAEEINGGTDERYPIGTRIRWDFPARGEMPEVKVYWYDGMKPGVNGKAVGTYDLVKGGARNVPPLLEELQKKYPEEVFDSNGTLYVGTKGILSTDTYGSHPHLVPFDTTEEITRKIPRLLPRPENIMDNFLDACRQGKKQTAASFEYGARLTELILTGNLTQYAGAGKTLVWDGPNARVTNYEELNQFIRRPYRTGWQRGALE